MSTTSASIQKLVIRITSLRNAISMATGPPTWRPDFARANAHYSELAVVLNSVFFNQQYQPKEFRMKKSLYLICLMILIATPAQAVDPQEQMDKAIAKAGKPLDMSEVAARPAMLPTQKIYYGVVALETQDGPYIRSISNFVFRLKKEPIRYVYLKFTNATHVLTEPQFNSAARVLGRYVGNVQYELTNGSVKTAPLIEVTYIQ